MSNEGIVKTYISSAAIVKHRIVKHGSGDRIATQASAATDLLIGVADLLGADGASVPVDVIRSGVALVEFGGTVTRGQKLTADADGKAIVAAPAVGVNAQIIGIAEVSGAAGDIGKVFIALGVMQG